MRKVFDQSLLQIGFIIIIILIPFTTAVGLSQAGDASWDKTGAKLVCFTMWILA